MTARTIKSVDVTLTTEEDKLKLKTYDNTKLMAINTCPTWGIVRYDHHKTLSGGGRAMALEAGSVSHEVYAAVRLWQLSRYQERPDLAALHGKRLFGDTRHNKMLSTINTATDDRAQSLSYCLAALETSSFYDDPSDRRRTFSNIEECLIAYIDRWDWNRAPVWIGPDDKSIGVEIPIDITLTYTFGDGTTKKVRFTGKIDGVHVKDGEIELQENKTGARLDEAWRSSFEMASQITGYCVATSVIIGEPVSKARILGMAIPLPKNFDMGGIVNESVRRESHHFERWFNWVLYTSEIAEKYTNDLPNAPMFTHSCNRYFRPCSMIPYCYADDEDRKQILEEMVVDEWSPLHDEGS